MSCPACISIQARIGELAYCPDCYAKLQAEVMRLERLAELRTTWAKSFYNARQKAELELERLRA